MMMILTSCPFWNLRFRGNGASRVWQDADCVLCIALTIRLWRESYYRKTAELARTLYLLFHGHVHGWYHRTFPDSRSTRYVI